MRLRRTTSPPSPDAGTPTLIGVDDLTSPWWAKVGEDLAVLGALLYTGGMPLALAGAAAVAMRTASAAVSTTVFSANRLFEHSFYLDMLTSCLSQAQGYHQASATR
jgi:hypothetical protein